MSLSLDTTARPQPRQDATSDTVGTYVADSLGKYSFYSIATDSVGNVEGPKAGADAQATISVLTAVGPGAPRFVNALSQNRPNPFNPETVIPYSLASKGRVAVRIYDISGRCIRTLVEAVKGAGAYQARWAGELDSGGRAASSIYFYRITYPDGTTSAKRMTILR